MRNEKSSTLNVEVIYPSTCLRLLAKNRYFDKNYSFLRWIRKFFPGRILKQIQGRSRDSTFAFTRHRYLDYQYDILHYSLLSFILQIVYTTQQQKKEYHICQYFVSITTATQNVCHIFTSEVTFGIGRLLMETHVFVVKLGIYLIGKKEVDQK